MEKIVDDGGREGEDEDGDQLASEKWEIEPGD